MEYNYKGLKIILPYEIERIEDIGLVEDLNDHSKVHIKTLVPENKVDEYIQKSTEDSVISISSYNKELKRDEIIFKGFILNLKMDYYDNVNMLEIDAVSYTYQWDIKRRSRSFQNLNLTYNALIKKVLSSYSKGDCMDMVTDGAVIGDFILQYEETDWQFLKRMATHFKTVIIPDSTAGFGRIFFGFPEKEGQTVLNEYDYEIIKDIEECNKNKFIKENDAISWKLKGSSKMALGSKVLWKDVMCQVIKVDLKCENDELRYIYTIKPYGSIKTKYQYNSVISGISLPATVKEVKGNSVAVHLAIDDTYGELGNNKFFTYALESSAWYCMPIQGSKVNIYFPIKDEKGAIAVNAIRTSKNSSKTSNPSTKTFSNDCGSEMKLDKSAITYSTGGVNISLNGNGNVDITGDNITINASGKLQLGIKESSPGIEPFIPSKISLSAKEGVYLSKNPAAGVNPSHAISIEDVTNLKGIKIINNATIKNPPSVTFDDSALKAQDAELMKQNNSQVQSEVEQKLQQGRGKFGFGAIAMAVGAVALFAAATVLTGGAAIAVAAAVGTASVAVGASEMAEGAADYTKAQSGDLSKSYNFMRDTVCGGNEKLYNVIKYGSVCIAAGIGLAAFGGAGALGKAAFDGGFRTAFNLISDILDDGSINKGLEYYAKDFTLSMASGVGTMKLTKIINKGNLGCAQKLFANTGVDTIADSMYQIGTGEDVTPLKNFAGSLVSNFVFSGDPINVTTGSLYIPAVDLSFADISGEWKLERQYNSVVDRTGLLGKSWVFSYESKLQIGDENSLLMLCTDGHVETFKLEDDTWQNTKGNSLRYELRYNSLNSEWNCTDNSEKLVYVYNKIGQLIKIIDKNNNKLTINYEGNSIDTLTTFSGHKLKFTYENNKIVQIEDAIGRKVQYRYDGDYLTHVCHVDHGITAYTYNEEGYISEIKDQNGNTYTKNYFDKKGRVILQEYPDGTSCNVKYDDDNRESTFYFTGSGRIEKYGYNENNLVTRIFYQDGTYDEYEYDQYENRIVEKDRKGNITYKSYNQYGNIEKEQSPGGLITGYIYDEEENLIKKEDNFGGEILFTYDNRGNVIEEKLKIEVGKWKKTKYEYDAYGRVTKITDPLNNVSSYEYEIDGLILPEAKVVKDGEGNIYSYEYDEAGRNTSITTEYGTVEFGYNTLDYVTLIQDGNGNITRKYYDKMGNLVRFVMPNEYNEAYDNGTAYEYRYDFFDKLIEIKDPLGNINRNIRDSEGNIIKEINPNYYNPEDKKGIGIEYVYDKDNRKIKTIYPDGGVERVFYDPNGNIVKRVSPEYYNAETDDGLGFSYSYDNEDRLTEIIAPDGTIEKTYVYDGAGNIIEEVDAKGNKTYYKYDIIGQVIEKREPAEEGLHGILYRLTLFIYDEAGNKVTERRGKDFVDKSGYSKYYHEIRFGYDKNNRLIEVKDNYGGKIQYGYDSLNNKTYECSRINEENYRRIYYKYDGAGNLIEKKQEINGGDISKGNKGRASLAITSFEYDKNGNIISIKTPNGHTIKRHYDKIDRIILEEEGDKSSGICRKYQYSYDKIGNILKIEDTNGNNKNYKYDTKNRLTHFINENGGITRLFYDKNDRIIKEVLPEQYNSDLDDGRGLTITYDAWDRVEEVRNALGELTKKNSYDKLGNIKATVDGLNQKVDFNYNLAGNLKSVITPNSGAHGKVAQSYTYDARGNITGVCDGNGNETKYKLDDWGRIVEIINPDGSVEQYTYDYAGNITSTKDGNGNVATYSYNSLNKLSEIKDQEGLSKYFYYDLEENLAETIDRNGNHLFYGYNIDRNITYRKEKEGTIWETFDYNKDGSLKMANTLGMAYSYSYTKDGRLKSKSTCGKELLKYEYDKNGNTISIEDISGKATCYTYDVTGRVVNVLDKNKLLANYSYNSDDTIKSITYGNGITTKYSYDGDKNIRSLITENSNGEILIDFNYVYDLNGNRLEKKGSKHESCYTYDSLNRLTSAKYKTPAKSLEESFTYDYAGNRLTKSTKQGIEKYKYNAKNQLIELQKDSGLTSSFYDKEGNLLNEQHPEGVTSYSYNAFNQTIKAVTKEGDTLVSRYDAEGLRYEIEENEKLTRFIFNKENIIAELDENNDVKLRLSRGYEVVSSQIQETRYYYHQEEQGSTYYITNEDEKIENSYFYDAFGVIIESTENIPNRISYTGQQYDQITQQYHLRARNYNPVIGRFTQEDTYRGDGVNLYAYCSNNPVIYYDPSGYIACISSKKTKNLKDKDIKIKNPKDAGLRVKAEGATEAAEQNYVLFNKTHSGSAPVPKGTGPNGGRLQSHHGLQQQWAKENLSQYGYDPELAPTVTIETGKGMPHTSISNAQNARRNARVASGDGKWSSSLQDELQYMVDDFTSAGFSKETINGVLEQQYKMLDKLKVPYERIGIK